jgi:hypothetical protein
MTYYPSVFSKRLSQICIILPPFVKVYAVRDRSREAKLTQIFSEVRSMGRRPDRRQTVSLSCPLAFSVTGLLLHCLALLAQSDDRGPATIGFALVAAAPALAAMAALHLAGGDFASDVDETRS